MKNYNILSCISIFILASLGILLFVIPTETTEINTETENSLFECEEKQVILTNRYDRKMFGYICTDKQTSIKYLFIDNGLDGMAITRYWETEEIQ